MRKPKQTEEIFLTDIKDPNAKNFIQPLYVALAEETTTTRRNISSTKDRTDKYANIENGIVPYTTGRGKGSGGNIEIRDAVILCQKAYYNIPIFTNVINLMGEFSNGKIYWKDGSAKSREFFAALFDSLGIWNIQDQFYREFYRSGNVFEYRFDGKVKEDDLKTLFVEVWNLKQDFKKVTFNRVPREENKAADKLVNKLLGRQTLPF